MEIAHISDLHIGISAHHDVIIERKLSEIAKAGVDHIILSGDITNTGDISECEKAISFFKEYGFYNSERMTIVPGNHDLFTSFFKQFKSPEDTYRNLYSLSKFLSYVAGYSLRSYKRDLERFNSSYNSLFEGVITFSKNFCGYPFIKYLNGNTVLIGIDSNALPGILYNPACSNGVCDSGDYKALLELLTSIDFNGKFKIAVMHNFLYSYESVLKTSNRWFARFMETQNVNRYITLFDKFGIDLIVHGHFHFNDKYYVGENKIKVLNGGGSRWGNWNKIMIKREELMTGS